VQGLERLERAIILHDTGDFIDDYAVDSALRNDLSFLFLVDADEAGLRCVQLIPVRLYMAQVRLAQGADADWICARMQTLSDQFGVALARTREGLELCLPGTGGAPFSANASRAAGAAT
jgi:poly-gamma-glutamate synthesis protein (capsule biosynthesis protein)